MKTGNDRGRPHGSPPGKSKSAAATGQIVATIRATALPMFAGLDACAIRTGSPSFSS